MYTPPVTPRKPATPEAGELTCSEVRGQKSEVRLGKRPGVKSEGEKTRKEDPNPTSDIRFLISEWEAAVEGGAGDWGEVVTR